MGIELHMRDICPFHLGSRVKVSPSCSVAADWPGVYVVTGLAWEPRDGSHINVSIMSDEEIQSRCGSTDGFRPDDLEPA